MGEAPPTAVGEAQLRGSFSHQVPITPPLPLPTYTGAFPGHTGAVHVGPGHSDSSPVSSTQDTEEEPQPGPKCPFPAFPGAACARERGLSTWPVTKLKSHSDKCCHLFSLKTLHRPLKTSHGDALQVVLNHFNKEKKKKKHKLCRVNYDQSHRLGGTCSPQLVVTRVRTVGLDISRAVQHITPPSCHP